MVSGNQAKNKSWQERKGKQSQFPVIIGSWTLAQLDSDVVGLHSCLCSSPPTEAIINTLRQRDRRLTCILSYKALNDCDEYSAV
jgi:hypothetical protein